MVLAMAPQIWAREDRADNGSQMKAPVDRKESVQRPVQAQARSRTM